MAAPGIPQKKTLSFWASSLNLCGWAFSAECHPIHWTTGSHPSWRGLAQVELRYEITMPALRWCTFCWVPLTGSCRYEIHVGSSGIAEGFFCWPGSMAFSRWLIRRSESFMKKSAKKTQNVWYFFSESQNDEVTLCETKHTNKVSTTLEGGSCLC